MTRPPLPQNLRLPHPSRLDAARPDFGRIMAAHDAAVAADQQIYVDPASGLAVFTAAALWEKGACCDSGCRHCPWLPRDG